MWSNRNIDLALKLKHTIWDLFAQVYWISGLCYSQSAWFIPFFYPYLWYFPSFFCLGPSAVNFQTIIWDKELVIHVVFAFYEPNHIFCAWNVLIMTTHRLLTCLLAGFFQKEWNKSNPPSVAAVLSVLHSDENATLQLSNLSSFFCFSPGTTRQNGTTGGHQSHGRHRGR